MFGALFYVAQRPKKIGELWNVVLEENVKDKIVRESN